MHAFDPVRGDKPMDLVDIFRPIPEHRGDCLLEQATDGTLLLGGGHAPRRAGHAARRFIFAAQNIFDIFLQCKFNN